MTERLADINSHIAATRQLGSVVNAMRGIAGARAQQARTQLAAVDAYTQIIAQSIGRILDLAPPEIDGTRRTSRSALVVFCAEQGFAGAFSEHVLDALAIGPAADIFLIGTRGGTIAMERGITAQWSTAMPSYSAGIPALAGRIAEALYARIADGKIDRLDALYNQWRPGQGINVMRCQLFPVDPQAFRGSVDRNLPLFNLSTEKLLQDLTAEYVHAQICHVAFHAFMAENEARMVAMAAARSQIEHQLNNLELLQRIVRQEDITTEIVELAAGDLAGRAGWN